MRQAQVAWRGLYTDDNIVEQNRKEEHLRNRELYVYQVALFNGGEENQCNDASLIVTSRCNGKIKDGSREFSCGEWFPRPAPI
jgi:hypothetical protein